MPEQPARRRGRPRLTPEQRQARLDSRNQIIREQARRIADDSHATWLEENPIEDRLQMPPEEQLLRYGQVYQEIIHEPVQSQLNVKVHIYPHFDGEDGGDGGIRRVVEAQTKFLPRVPGIRIVATAAEADVIAYHATCPPPYINNFPRKAFVAMCHGLYWSEYEWGNWAIKANADVMEGIRVSDAVISCSEWVANAIRRHTSRPAEVIYHGVELEDWTNPEGLINRGFVLWNKTRPDPVCDPEAMNQVAALLPDVPFVSTFGEETENVAVTGKLPFLDAKKLILQAGAYLCTTRETFGIGTLEAMAAGVPIVGFDFAGQAEFIEHGIDGWLVTPGDYRGLAEGIRWALGTDRPNISAAARRKAAAFDWSNIASRYAEIFSRVAAAKRDQEIQPRTSIIVTNYNLDRYLVDCLNSVVEQSDPNWECIIVDDASTNDTRQFIASNFEHLDPRFKFIRNQTNVYLSEARNIGIRVAQGRYILPLDADDMLATDAVALLADALDSDRSIHVAYGNVQFREEDGQTLTNYGQQFTLGHSSWPYPFSHEHQLMQRNLLPYCSMFRREAWEWTGGYRRRCKTAEDADFWARLSSYGFRPKMVTEQDTLIYRNRLDSMSRVQGESNWVLWFPWSKKEELTPAGAGTREQLPVASLDPIVVSVIIPVGPGHEKIVTDAIDSVDAQFFRQWECIVINDTGAPLLTELPAWVKVLSTGSRGRGVAHARNIGIEASRGRYFLPLDADDYLEPDALAFMVQAVREDGGASVVYSDFWQTDGGAPTIHQTDDYDPHLITGNRRQINGVWREGMMHSVTALTPKAFWKLVGGYDETLPAWEDWDFQIALGNAGLCSRRIAIPLFFYRKHTGYRREENVAFFEQSKEGILRKWGNLFREGGRELMACQRCGAGRTVSAAPIWTSSSPMSAAQIDPNGEAVLLKYVGDKMGDIGYRAPSRQMYYFGKDAEKYVLASDAQYFLNMGDFVVVQPREVLSEDTNQPILAAQGQA